MSFLSFFVFYVTLWSHASTREFPANQSPTLKIVYHKHSNNLASGWQVGLASLSLPDSKWDLQPLINKNDHPLYVRWHEHVWDETDKKYYLCQREMQIHSKFSNGETKLYLVFEWTRKAICC